LRRRHNILQRLISLFVFCHILNVMQVAGIAIGSNGRIHHLDRLRQEMLPL
jgi:hypothetical protein